MLETKKNCLVAKTAGRDPNPDKQAMNKWKPRVLGFDQVTSHAAIAKKF